MIQCVKYAARRYRHESSNSEKKNSGEKEEKWHELWGGKYRVERCFWVCLKAIKRLINAQAAASSWEHCLSLSCFRSLFVSVSLSIISDVVQWNVVLSLQMDLAESTKIYLPLDTHSLIQAWQWDGILLTLSTAAVKEIRETQSWLSKCVHDCVRD